MRKLFILFTALLGLVGAVQAQSSIYLFTASGGEKKIYFNIQPTGTKDSVYKITVYYSIGTSSTYWPMKSYTLKATGITQSIVDSATDSTSANSLPVCDTICVIARMESAGFIDTLSNQICGIKVTDIILKPKISQVSKPDIAPSSVGTWVLKPETNGPATISVYTSLDSIGTYKAINKRGDTTVSANPVFPNMSLPIGSAPPYKAIWVRAVIVNSAGKDSIGPVKSNVFFPPIPATCELDSVATFSNMFGVRLKIIGAGLPTDGWIEAMKAGTSTWFVVSDTGKVTGNGVQFLFKNTYQIFEPETGYYIRGGVFNGLGTKNYSYVSNPFYTNKKSNLGYFTITINKVVENTHGAVDVTFTTTTANNTTASAYIKFSEDRSLTPATVKGPYTVTSSSDTRTEHIVLSKSGKFWLTGYGMDSKGVQIDSGNVLSVMVHNWSVGMDINKDLVNLQSEPGVQYQIVDMTGKVVADGMTEDAFKQIDLIDLPTGMYSCILTKGTYIQIGKIIK